MEVKEPSAKYLVSQFKRTEAGEIPFDWIDMPIGAMAEVTSGGTPSRKVAAFWDGDIPWVTTAELDGGQITAASQHITAAGLQNSAAKWLAPGTLLIALYGQGKTRGKCAVLRIAATTNQACAAITLSKEVDSDFVRHNLTHRYEYIRSLSNGGSQENLSGLIVKQIRVGLPPTRREQHSIASALTDADALIDSLEQLLTKKRQIKQGAMQELLTGQRRLPGFEAPWKDRPIKALADIQRGASPRPIDDPVWFDNSSSVGWVRISDVTQSGMYLRSTTQRLSEAGIRNSRFVPSGNLIMSICATVGRPIITELDTCIHDGFVVFDALTVNQKFLYYALLKIEDEWSRHGQTGSQMNLNTGLINGTAIPVPDDAEEQAAVAQVLSDMDTELTALESRLTKARALKQAMAQALLTGRIRLVEPTA